MGLTKLSTKCQKCPYANECDYKQMEVVGYLEPCSEVVKAEMAMPIMRETVNTIVNGEVVKIYKDDLEKVLYKDLYSHLGLRYGG